MTFYRCPAKYWEKCGNRKLAEAPFGLNTPSHISRQSVLSSVDDSRQLTVELFVEIVSGAPCCGPVAMPLLEAVQDRVLVRQSELVGEQLATGRQPRRVAHTVHADSAHLLPVTLPVAVQPVPVLDSDDGLRRVRVSDR